MKNSVPFQWCSILMTILIVAGCQIKKPDDVLSETKMENLLYDYHIAKAMGESMPSIENYNKVLYVEAVFKKHATTESVFDSSMVWYTRNTEVLSKIYEKVNKRLKTEQESINHLIALRDKKPKTTTPGDSIDVWYGVRMARLTGMPLNNRLAFILPTDSNYHPKDTLVWQVRYHFFDKVTDSTKSVVMAMQIRYANDSIISTTKRVLNAGIESIRLQSDTLGAIKEVKGFIYYTKGQGSSMLLADRIALMRYHSTDTLSAYNDSIRADSIKSDSIKTDSIKNAAKQASKDTIKQEVIQQRLSPEEMNRRHKSSSHPRTREPLTPVKKPTTVQPTTRRR